MTRREEIVEILSNEAKSAQELANHYAADLAEIIDDLEHIKLSVKPRKLEIIPARCKSCGFVFKERSKLKRPSRCPRCREERVMAPLFRIR